MRLIKQADTLRALLRGLPLAHRIGLLASVALIATVAAPWAEYTPFMDGFWDTEPEGPSIVRGFEAPGQPGMVAAVLGAVGALLPLVRDDRVRSFAGVAVFGLAAAWSIAFVTTDGLWTCIVCEVERVLWGAYVAAALAITGTVAMAWGLRDSEA